MRLIDADSINDFRIDFSSYKEGPDEDDVKAWLDEQSTIEAEPVRHGVWVPISYDGYSDGQPIYDEWECSECHYECDSDGEPPTSNYCPNCGAKMDGKENKE